MTAASLVAGCARGEPLETRLGVDFADQPDGRVADVADTGQQWVQTSSRPAAVPAVVDGRFTNEDTLDGRSANYLTAQLAGPVAIARAQFEFGPTGDDNANVTLIAASEPFPGGEEGIGTPPDMSMHVAFTPSGWIWSHIADGAAELTTVKTVPYRDRVAGTEAQNVEVVMNTAAGTAHVRGADGVVTTIVDPTISSIPSPYFTVEVYYDDASVARRVSVADVEATSSPEPMLSP